MKLKLICVWSFGVFLLASSCAVAAVSDNELHMLAEQNNALQEDEAGEYPRGNFINTWIRFRMDSKMTVIRGFIGKYRQRGIIIEQPAQDYVGAINDYLYRAIAQGNIHEVKTKGLGFVFKYIAVTKNDFRTAGQ